MLKEYAKNNLINVISSVVAGLGNWLFSFLILKLVSENDLTTYSSFASIVLIFSFPSAWVTLMTVRLGIKFKEKIINLISQHKLAFVIATLIGIAILALIFVESNFSIILFILGSFLISIGLISAYFRGILQHEMLFDKLGILAISEAIEKILLFLILIALKGNSVAMFVATTVQSIISFFVLLVITKNLKSHAETQNINLVGVLTLVYSVSFLFATNVDVIFAKIHLDTSANANYIGLLQIGKLILFGSTALIGVFLPSIQKYVSKVQIIKLTLLTTLAISAGGLFVIVATALEFSKISSIFHFTDVGITYSVVYFASTIILSLAQIPLTILLVKEQKSIILVVIVTTLTQFALYLFFGRSLIGFIKISLIYSVLLSVLSILALLFRNKFSAIKLKIKFL